MKRFPKNSPTLTDMRERGEIPALPILVSFIGPLGYNNVTLQGDVSERYDWRPVAALDVEIFASASVEFPKLLRALSDIAEVVPQTMVLTFKEGPRVHCGEWRQIDDFRLFDWFPMAIGPSCYPQGGVIARKILSELGRAIPIPYDEACDLFHKVAREKMQ